METKILKSINLIRCVSGANLNLFRYTAMVAMLLMLGVSETWAHSNHTGKVTLVNATGNGTVYLSTASGSNSGQTSSSNPGTKNGTSIVSWSCGSSSSGDAKTLYPNGTPSNGYYYAGWTTASNSTSGYSTNSLSADAQSDTDKKIYGYFAEITINNGTASPTHINATDNSTTATTNTTTITFATKADAKNDFKDPAWTKTGHGTFSGTWEVASNGTVTYSCLFRGDGTYGGNVAAANRSRTTTGTLTLTSAVGNNKNACTVTASFPNITIAAGEGTSFNATLNEEKQSTATFAVEYADDADDFTAEFSDETTGSTWGVDDISYADGVVTVTYTFNSTVADTHTATLTLTANDNAGGASNTAELTAISKAKASDDASVTYNNTTTNYSTIAAAIAAANSQPGAVVTLLRNIPSETTPSLSSPIEITGLMTLDLNSYTIARTGMADGSQQVITVNMSNAASVLTIKDSSVGHDGKISGTGGSNGNMLYAVCMEKGVLNFESGIVECTNTNSGDNAKATGIRVKNGCKLLMQGGTINATTSGNPARGIFSTTSPDNAQMVVVTGGTINTTAAAQSIGIECESTGVSDLVDPAPEKGNVILSGVTINAETSSAAGAYAVRTAAGVVLGINNGTYNATAKTQNAYSIHSSGYTAVVTGTFNATSTTRTAFGIFVNGGIAAVKGGTITATAATHEADASKVLANAKLLTYGGTFRGICSNVASDGWATGSQIMSGGTLEAQGGTFVGEVNKAGLSAEQTALACGVYANTGSNVTMSNATLRGQVNTDKLKGNTAANYYGAHGLLSITANKVMLTNCTIQGQSAYDYSFGIRTNASPIEIKNCTVSGTGRYATYGIYAYGGKAVNAANSSFSAVSQSTLSRGALVYAALTADACTFNSQALQSTATAAGDANVRGVWIPSGYSATLNNCTVTASGSTTNTYANNVHGLSVDGTVDVEGGTVTASNANSTAYAICANVAAAKIGVGSGKFKATATSTYASINSTANVDATRKLYGGYYNTNTNLSKYLPAGYGIETLPSTSTEYGEGYRYAIRATEDVGDPVCKIGATPYTTLEEALEYASKNATSSNKLTILMVKDYTLKAGDYILPAYTTLLVPYKSDQTSAIGTTPSRASSYATRSPYRTLTFASGAKMTVYGTIEASAQQNSTDQTSSGEVRGPFGYIILNENAGITLENGASLIAWGFVCGKGTITVKNGAKAYEMMSIGWYKGGNTTSTLYSSSSYKVFVITDYAYQNIECPITYHPGAQALGAAATEYFKPNDIVLVGTTNTSFFKMVAEEASADTWVRKEYDPKTDYTTWTMNNGASMSAIKLDSYSSENFYLPITSNFRIIMNYGEMNLGGDIEFHAGAELIIKKEATGKIASGKTVVFYDDEDWRTGLGSSGKYYYPVTYSPSWKAATNATTNPRLAKYKQTSSSTASEYLPDASLFIQGKLEVSGYLYTTGDGNKATANRNSNIYSSNEDAGQIIYKTAAPANTSTKTMYKCTHMYGVSDWKSITDMLAGGNSTAYPALLQNAGGTYETTGGTSSGSSWIYKNDHWVMVTTEGCFSVEQISGVKHYYAYPAGFVEVTSKDADATTHLYTDAETGNRRFLAESDCTWWEVEPEPYDGNKYKCVNPDHNGRYKYYEYVGNAWQEAVVTVTWKNGDATIDTYSSTLYGTRPKYLNPSPTRDKTAGEYYTWLGWTKGSADGEFYAKDAELPVATENTTYYAYFETHKFEYTITFRSHDGAVLEAKRWAHGEIPTYDGTPTKTPTAAKEYTFDGWSSTKGGSKVTVAAASAATDYYAHFAESDRKYTIQWVNYNGMVLKEEQVAYNTTPSEPATPTRPNDDYYTYTFDTWSPAVGTVTGNQTYTATYNYEKMVTKHEVLFKNGTTTIFSQNLVENSVPVFDGNEPTKDPTAQYSYTFDGWSTTNGGALAYAKGAALPALTANVTYYAHFASTTNTYKVLWKSEDGKQLLETDPAVEYNTDPSFDGIEPTKVRVGKNGFAFDGWSASIGGSKLAPLPKVTEDKVFYAHFLVGTYYDITFNANGHGTAPTGYEAIGGSKLNAPEEPTETGYTFGGWYKESACTNKWNFATETVTGDVTLYAKWTPNTNTEYLVEHCWQNIVDDNYTMHETVNMTGTTDAATAAAAIIYDGFEAAQPFDQGTIAPDGTTVVKIYYNRKTYTITWVDGNGTTIETDANVKYGATPAYNGSTPTKNQTVEHIYTFNETWYPAISAVTGSQTYTAQFDEAWRLYDITWRGEGIDQRTDQVAYGSTPVYGELPTQEPTKQQVFTYEWMNVDNAEIGVKPVTGDATYEGSFTGSPRPYMITFVNDDNTTVLQATEVGYGSTPAYSGTPVSKIDASYVFIGWTPAIELVSGVATYVATYKRIVDPIDVAGGDTETVEMNTETTTTTVHVAGALHVPENVTLSTTTFTIEAISEVTDTDEAFASAQSGSGEATGHIEADVMYFDLKLNNPSNRRWNAFTVPFVVDLRKSGHPIQINGETLTLGRGYDIIYYNGAMRAAQGPVAACWEYVEDPAPKGGDSILYPGKAYMIASASRAIQTVRFTKATDPDILSLYDGKVSVAENATEITTGNNGGWNGIGNPTMYHAVMNAGVTLCQVHDGGQIGSDGYRTYDMDDKKLYVGKAVFVQVGNDDDSISIVQATTQEAIKPQTAPRRRTPEQIKEERLDVQIAANGYAAADRLLILAEEDKEDKYVILKDLSKAGVSPVRAQMWVDRYGEKLCMNTTALINNKATYPLTISIPKAGEYNIFLNGQAQEGTTLYLTYDGKAIWNLTYGGYTASLEKGLDTHYGLRVVRKSPMITTGIEETTIQNGDPIRKVMVDGKVYIIRNGEIYSITGQKAQ